MGRRVILPQRGQTDRMLPAPDLAALRVYLAGPPAEGPRVDATARLRSAGAAVTVVRPRPGQSRGDMLNREATALLDADLVVLLPGWQTDPATAVRLLSARAAGIPCAELAEVLTR